MLLKLPMPEFTSEDRAAPPTSSDPQAQNKILFYPFNNLPIREPDAECRRLGPFVFWTGHWRDAAFFGLRT